MEEGPLSFKVIVIGDSGNSTTIKALEKHPSSGNIFMDPSKINTK